MSSYDVIVLGAGSPGEHCAGELADGDTLGGVPGLWFRPAHTSVDGGGVSQREEPSVPPGTILYLQGGGYIGTSPRMYALFVAHLTRVTGCHVFVADYRLAREFPFPAAADDIIAVANHLVARGPAPERLVLAGDSGGGGLVGPVLHRMGRKSQRRPAAVLLFSPEVSLTLSEDSVGLWGRRDVPRCDTDACGEARRRWRPPRNPGG